MKEVFAAVATRENGQYEVIDSKFDGSGGSKMFVSYYNLDLDYKGHHIHVGFEMGNHNMAKVEMHLLPGETIPEFSISNRSHYYRLFYRKANILKVQSSNITFKKYLEDLLNSTNLEMLARKNLFEPQISILRKDNTKAINTEFHLVFEDKEGVLDALINFYKGIIDRL